MVSAEPTAERLVILRCRGCGVPLASHSPDKLYIGALTITTRVTYRCPCGHVWQWRPSGQDVPAG